MINETEPWKTQLGRLGEDAAVRHLRQLGFQILDRNWRCRLGEIDVVAREGNEVVFVEVKTRSTERYGHPFAAITPSKLGRLRRLAAAWCECENSHAHHIRIDAVAIVTDGARIVRIEHLERIS